MAKYFIQNALLKLNAYTLVVIGCCAYFTNTHANELPIQACDIPDGWHLIATTQSSNIENSVAIDLNAEKIKLNQPFSFKVAVCNKENEKPQRITANAIMPAHQHGMNYAPTINRDAQTNQFTVKGFLFHMPGEWEITVSQFHDEQVTHHTKLITINE